MYNCVHASWSDSVSAHLWTYLPIYLGNHWMLPVALNNPLLVSRLRAGKHNPILARLLTKMAILASNFLVLNLLP